MDFQRLFSPMTIKTMELRNRIVMLPMTTGFIEPDETVGERFISYYAARAEGGAGLIIIPFTPMEDGSHVEPGLFHDRFIPGVRSLTSRLHDAGAQAAAQLIITYVLVLRNGVPEIVAPSPLFNKVMHTVPRELTIDEIEHIIAAYGSAARRAREGGFDAVEVLVGAGYLLNRFLSPISNERQDRYGGSPENRLRIITDIIAAIRRETGETFPLICRLNLDEQMPGGLTIDDSKEIARILERKGVDVISTYTGWHESPIPTVAASLPKGAFAYLSGILKKHLSIPVIASNRINDPWTAEDILARGQADLIGMGRALMADPDLPRKSLEGRADEIVPCLACSNCLARIMTGKQGGAGESLCSVNPRAGKERERPPEEAERKKRVSVIGGGPGGMTAAMTAAARGHAVTLFEKHGEPGGRLAVAALPPFKSEIKTLTDSLYTRACRAGVHFRFNTPASPELLKQERPDAVVLAVGADVLVPPIDGIDGPTVVQAEEVLTGTKTVRGSVLIVGGGLVGCESAEFLVEQGLHPITIVEMLGRMADNVAPTYRPFLLARLKKAGVVCKTKTTVTEITDRGVAVTTAEGPAFIPADAVIIAAGYRANPLKKDMFRDSATEIHAVGDCVEARMIKEAVEEGFAVGMML